LPTGRVPVTPVVSGRPVALVSVKVVGVPRAEPDGIVTVPVKVGLANGAYVVLV
jgi:hypothetical protein